MRKTIRARRESWGSLLDKIEEAKLTLVISRRRIRSEEAAFNFKNFLRGLVYEVDTIAFFYAQRYPDVTNPTADHDLFKLMAFSSMLTYGTVEPTERNDFLGDWESATNTPVQQVILPEWLAARKEERNRG